MSVQLELDDKGAFECEGNSKQKPVIEKILVAVEYLNSYKPLFLTDVEATFNYLCQCFYMLTKNFLLMKVTIMTRDWHHHWKLL